MQRMKRPGSTGECATLLGVLGHAQWNVDVPVWIFHTVTGERYWYQVGERQIYQTTCDTADSSMQQGASEEKHSRNVLWAPNSSTSISGRVLRWKGVMTASREHAGCQTLS